jgi:PAS domain S-box-containing protein
MADRRERRARPGLAIPEHLPPGVDPLPLLEALFAASPVAFQVYDADGSSRLTNQAFRELFGSEPPVGYNVFKDEVAQATKVLDQVRRAFRGETVTVPPFWYDARELRHVQVTEGRRVAIAATFFPLFNRSGAVSHVAIVFKDVTRELQSRDEAVGQQHGLQRALERIGTLSQELREAEARLSQTLEAARVGTWEWQIAENRVAWSRNIEALFDLEPGSFTGSYQAWLALVHPDDRERLARQVSDAISARMPYDTELRYLRQDGSTGWQAARGYLVKDEEGHPVALRGVVFDITDRKQAEAALRDRDERLREALAAGQVGTWRLALNLESGTRHPGFNQLLGLDPEETSHTGEDFFAPIHPDDRGVFREAIREAVRQGRDLQSEHRVVWPGGEVRWLRARGRVIHNAEGGAAHIAGASADITDQQKARAEAERHSEFERQLVSIVSHDLKNPLSAIRMSASLLLKRGRLDFQQARSLGHIASSAERAGSLITDFLDFTQARTAGGITVHPRLVNLRNVVGKVVEEMQLAHPEREVVLQHVGSLQALADEDRLAQAISNLVGNALQHSPPTARIVVRTAGDAERKTITVSNEGPPIPEEDLLRLFQPDHRKCHGGGSPRSAGLGLYITQQIVLAHGGRISVKSDQEGTCFTVLLPGLGSEAVHLTEEEGTS